MSIRRAQDERLEGTPDGLTALTEISDVPDAPTIGTATAGAESASVTFTAAATGGSVTTFRATSTPGSITGTSATSPVTISGLTAGTSYTFQIRGENATGNSAYSSASNSITALAPSFGYLALGSPTGSNYTTEIQKLNMNSGTLIAGGGDLSQARATGAGLSNSGSSGAGYIWGGTNNFQAATSLDRVDKIAFSNDTKSNFTAPTSIYQPAGCSNLGVAGYVMGGWRSGSGRVTTVTKINFSNDSVSNTNSLAIALQASVGGENNGTAGYALGGNTSGGYQSLMQKIAFSNDTRTTLSNSLDTGFADANATSNKGDAMYTGGGGPNGSSTAQGRKFTFSTESSTTRDWFLGNATFQCATASNNGVAGFYYHSGGRLDRLTFSNETVTFMQNGNSSNYGMGVSQSGTF